MKKPAVHKRDRRLYVNAGISFPACYADAACLDMDKTRLHTTPHAEDVTCKRCKRSKRNDA